ncbi:flagellar basal body P-ring formation protein FlgA [Marinomonas sp. M1K-6]|uniref:Flagella basal body P-ring formation protein FlgA n=1 Tax=Marinomonas profundi TaxID=2726122 RepID=A0A847R9B1_9GAMM|nr:flagellar basal body P-ring formation chaperone FlgA [Marinomonas profundi]NLQ17534.1 flagellar basal body P-ring formation protein FlgA [Marinomonas profundi]UDV02249.1 flagellar basal body P-ring formation protein FlgA [Marinomonas profundi]
MRIIRLMIAFICCQAGLLLAAPIEQQITNYINDIEIPRLIEIYPNARIDIALNNLAALNYLPNCDNAKVQISNQRPDATKRTNYEITCDSPSWTSYVPVTQSIMIEAIRTITPIDRGQVINQSNTDVGEVDLTSLRGHVFTTENPPYGLIASRNLRINTFLTDNVTNQPTLVKKGDIVLITASSGTIIVRMNGVALENGIKGQQIRVKNTSSERIVYAKVVTDSEVLVNY